VSFSISFLGTSFANNNVPMSNLHILKFNGRKTQRSAMWKPNSSKLSWSPRQKKRYYIGPNFGPKLFLIFLWVFARNKGIPVLLGTLLEIRFVYDI
jgi:hypothetical protein